MRLLWFVLVAGAVGLINCDKQDIEGRIIRGSKASYRQFPMYVQMSVIRAGYGPPEEVIGCGGTILTKRHILTTASCVSAERRVSLKNAIFHVYAGRPRVWSDTRLLAEQKIRVNTIISHPVFNPLKRWGLDNDIAIVVLEQPLQWTDTVQPVKLADSEFGTIFNDNCYTAGMGIKKFRRDPDFSVTKIVYADTLWVTKVAVSFNYVCNYYIRKSIYYWNTITPSQLCTATLGGNNVCQGDGAAPVLCKDEKGDFRLVGMASYGMGGYYCVMGISFNTRVAYYLDWIAEHMA